MTDDNASLKKIASRLRKARRAKQLTQVELAKKAGISISYYAQVEQSRINPTASKLLQIIDALGVSSKDIFGK